MTVSLFDVTIRYGAHVAVQDLTVVFPAGAVGLLGRNGAGKSSILKALLGLVRPAHGRLEILGLPENALGADIRARIGYMPEREAHLPQASGFEMVSLLGMLSGVRKDDAWRRAHEVLYQVGLEEERYRPVAGYSAGMRQKAKLAAALVHDPQVLLLDEPTNGLDPAGRSDMLKLIRDLSRVWAKSVIVSTHILQDVEAVCDAAVVIERGRIVAQGSIADLTVGGARELALVVDPPHTVLRESVSDGFKLRKHENGNYTVWLAPDAGTAGVFAMVQAGGGTVRSLVPRRRSLEDVFLQAVQAPARL